MPEIPIRKRGQWDGETSRLNIKLPKDLHQWALAYARRKSNTLSQILRDYLVALKEEEDSAREGTRY